MRKIKMVCIATALACVLVQANADSVKAQKVFQSKGAVTDVRFSKDGSKIAFASKNAISLYGVDGTLIKRFGIKDGADIDLIDYAGGLIATYSYTPPAAQINLWNESGSIVKKLCKVSESEDDANANADVETAKSYRMAFSPDGASIVTTSATENHGGLKIRDVATGKVTSIAAYDDTSVYGCSFSQDGKKFATISRDESVKVWACPTGKLIASIAVGDELETSYYGKDVAFLGNDTLVVLKNDLQMWSLDGKPGKTIDPISDNGFTRVVASPDGSRFAVALASNGFALYGKDGTLIKVYTIERELDVAVTGMAFSPDGKSLAVATDGGDLGAGEVLLYTF